MSAEHWYAGSRPSHRPKTNPIAFLTELNTPAWMSDSLCAQTDPEVFFPEKGGSVREAKAVCAVCDVKDQCLAYALERGERFGIWGGLSDLERRRTKANPKGTPRPCRRDGCTETIPATASSVRHYHDAECGNLARQDRLMASMDHASVVAGYRAGSSVTVLAKRYRVPITVISRILEDQEVRRIRGRRPSQAAS